MFYCCLCVVGFGTNLPNRRLPPPRRSLVSWANLPPASSAASVPSESWEEARAGGQGVGWVVWLEAGKAVSPAVETADEGLAELFPVVGSEVLKGSDVVQGFSLVKY